MKNSLATKLGLLVVGIVTVVLLGLGFWNYNKTKRVLEEDLQNGGQYALERLAKNLPKPLWEFDVEQAVAIMESEMTEKSIFAIVVFDADANFSTGRTRDEHWMSVKATAPPEGSDLQLSRPLVLPDAEGKLGDVKVYLSHRFVQAALQGQIFDIVLQTLLLNVFVTGLLVIVLRRQLLRPLKEVVHAAELISVGDLGADLNIRQRDEIGQLSTAFRQMVEALKKRAAAANNIASGNLAVDVDVKCGQDLLGNAMVTMIAALNQLNADLNFIIEEQKAGKLSSRCDTAELGGAFSDMLKGVNDVLNTVIEPMLEGMQILEEYAKGNLEHTMRELPGDQIFITEGLNTIHDNLQALINEGRMLAVAAQEGNLKNRGDVSKFLGGYREIIQGFNDTIENILEPVSEVAHILSEVADGNLSFTVNGDYKGDHAVMKTAMNKAVSSLGQALTNVSIAVEQISNGARQVSNAVQQISHGSVKQASSLQEITASMNVVSSQSRKNADDAAEANEIAATAGEAAETGNKKMKRMLSAMNEINDSAGQISSIIKVIDEIAFQTNLLALNAAVEAARAGVHGKGFAVVAEEVRNLAQRSAAAANQTTELIQGAVARVENGNKIAGETAEAFANIIEGISKVSSIVEEITSASQEQVQGLTQITNGLTQVDQVTQTTAASAEQSAAATEQLSGECEQLREMLGKFQLPHHAVRASVTPQGRSMISEIEL